MRGRRFWSWRMNRRLERDEGPQTGSVGQAQPPPAGVGEVGEVYGPGGGALLARGSVPVDSATVAVTLVPVARTPPVYEVLIRMQVPPP